MTSSQAEAKAGAGSRLQRVIESRFFERFIITVILVNAVTLSLETSKTAMAAYGDLLIAIDRIALSIFVVEISAKLFVYRLRFFKSAWNLFDFAVVGIALIPATGSLSVLRALRILRILRLITVVPKMRQVVQALFEAIPGMLSVIALLGLVFYVFAVMATKLFGAQFDAWFGTIGRSLYSLFQIMTLESWSMGIVRPVMEVYPYAWVYFVAFVILTTFAVLNLFIAIIVNSMHEVADEKASAQQHEDLAKLHDEIKELRRDLARMQSGAGPVPTEAPREPER